MICPTCGKEMRYCGTVKVLTTKGGGILDQMGEINVAEYCDKYECDKCQYVMLEKSKSDHD